MPFGPVGTREMNDLPAPAPVQSLNKDVLNGLAGDPSSLHHPLKTPPLPSAQWSLHGGNLSMEHKTGLQIALSWIS